MNIAAISEAAYSGGFRDVKSNAIASAIAMGESGGKEDATGDGGDSHGLWQIHRPSHPGVSEDCANSRFCAARQAYLISNGGRNWTPWTIYRIGAHLRYMPEATKQARITIANKGKNPNSSEKDGSVFPFGLDPIGRAKGLVSDAVDPIRDIANFFQIISQKNTWIRVAYFLGGLIALYIAVKILMAEEGIKGPKVGQYAAAAITKKPPIK